MSSIKSSSVAHGVISEVGLEMPTAAHDTVQEALDLLESGADKRAAATFCKASQQCTADAQRWLVLNRARQDMQTILHSTAGLSPEAARDLAAGVSMLQLECPPLPGGLRNEQLRQAVVDHGDPRFIEAPAVPIVPDPPQQRRLPTTACLLDSVERARYSAVPSPYGRVGIASLGIDNKPPPAGQVSSWFGYKSPNGIIALFDGPQAGAAERLAPRIFRQSVEALSQEQRANPAAVSDTLRQAAQHLERELPGATHSAAMLLYVDAHLYVGQRGAAGAHELIADDRGTRVRSLGGNTADALHIAYFPQQDPRRRALLLTCGALGGTVAPQFQGAFVRNALVRDNDPRDNECDKPPKPPGAAKPTPKDRNGMDAEHAALALVAAARKKDAASKKGDVPLSAIVVSLGSA